MEKTKPISASRFLAPNRNHNALAATRTSMQPGRLHRSQGQATNVRLRNAAFNWLWEIVNLKNGLVAPYIPMGSQKDCTY